MGVVSFRLADDDEQRLRQAGINPGPWAKAQAEAKARSLRAAARRHALEGFSRPAREPVVDTVRRIREEH